MPVLLKDSDKSKTQSAISEGTITIRNPDGANDLAGLNRDTANANQHLDLPDEKAMQERIDLIQSSAQLSSSVIRLCTKSNVVNIAWRRPARPSPHNFLRVCRRV